MNKWLRVVWVALLLSAGVHAATQYPLYELRIYRARPGKLGALEARFRDHAAALLERHGAHSLGYWVPVKNSGRELVVLLEYPNREAAERAWAAFNADPQWQKAQRRSELHGRLVDQIESTYLRRTDYSPEIVPLSNDGPRLYEMQICQSAAGRLPSLHQQCREYTMKFLHKHGIKVFGYWVPIDGAKQADQTQIAILVHKDLQSAKKAWEDLQRDPEWQKARAATETDGPLVASRQSIYMEPTDFSPTQ